MLNTRFSFVSTTLIDAFFSLFEPIQKVIFNLLFKLICFLFT